MEVGHAADSVVTTAIGTDATVEITLHADWPGAMSVTVDAVPVATAQSGGDLTFTLAAGTHETVVG